MAVSTSTATTITVSQLTCRKLGSLKEVDLTYVDVIQQLLASPGRAQLGRTEASIAERGRAEILADV